MSSLTRMIFLQLYNSKDNKVAVLCHAGVWLWGSDYDTGNFVPINETAPNGLPEGRMYVPLLFLRRDTRNFSDNPRYPINANTLMPLTLQWTLRFTIIWR